MSIPNSGYRANRSGRYGRLRAGMDPATRRLIMFAGGLAAVLICLIGASTLLDHRSGGVPVVTADSRPIRVKPDNPGGMQIDGAENDVFSGGVDGHNARLAPAAETPDPNGMHFTAAPPPPLAPSIASASVPPVAARPSAVSPPLAVQPAAVATAAPSRGASAAPAKPLAAATATVAPVSTPPAVAPKPAAGAAATSGRSTTVQLAALATEQAVREEWQQLSKRMPDLLGGHQPSFSRVERDGHTFWRLRMAGFQDMTEAKAFCNHVRAKGGGCSVAEF